VVQHISDWLTGLGLGQYAERFSENGIDLSVLRDLTDEDLEKLGVLLGHRRKMLRAVAALDGSKPAATQSTAAPRLGDDAERRQLTVMFCDLVGSTALSTRLDPEDMGEVISAYQQACAGVIRAYDGFVAKYMGDGVLIYFGYPRAHEDDAERAVRAGLDIAAAIGRLKTADRQPLQVRIGIATGLVVVGHQVGEGAAQEQAVVGDTPNLAARLQGLAEPGTIVVATSTRRLLGNVFTLRDLGRHELKGLTEPVTAWAVEGAAVSESRFETARSARPAAFIGREQESERLLDLARLAWSGKGQYVLISGEAGIGKSRIAASLDAKLADQRHIRVRYQCSPYHTNSALYPSIRQLEHATGFKPDDPPERRLDKLEAVIALAVPEVATVTPLLAALLSVPTGTRYPPLALSAQQQRRHTLHALVDQLAGLSQKRPVLLLYEDAHWADATSLELLDLTLERIRDLPILAIITFRPDFEAPWTGLPNVTTFKLGRLDRDQVRAIAEQVAGGRSLPAEVMEQIIAKTDGVPLFVEELTKTVLESGLLVEEGGCLRLDGPLPPFAIPATLQDSLMARLDHLSQLKETAQIGAAIGREFSYALLSAVTGHSQAILTDALIRLEDAELVFRRGKPPEATYTFKHALVRDVAYESLLKSRRAPLHQRIAESVRDRFPAIAQTQPEIVAHHFTEAGLKEAAFEWWGKAGDQALRRSAYVEATAHFRKALELIEGLASGPQQRLSQLRIQLAYGQALIHTRSWGAAETTAAFARARELATGIEDLAERFVAYWGIWAGCYVRAELAPMRELADALLNDAKQMPGSPEECVARRLAGETCWFAGDYTSARDYYEQALAIYDPKRDAPLVHRFAQDIGVTAMVFLALASWPLGEVERARQVADKAVALAAESGHVPTIAFALFHKILLDGVRGDAAACLPHAEALVGLCRDHNIPHWVAAGTFQHGWARWQLGEREAGLAGMRQGAALYRQAVLEIYFPFRGMALAEAIAETEGPEAGLVVLDEALAEIEHTGERWLDAELHRRRGELLRRARPADAAAAETAFARAIEIARGQQTKTFELRAVLSLAKLYDATGRGKMAREALAPVVAAFGKQDLPEIAEAERLLARREARARG
jgi:class 3 adenylate cyclase/predicted ATPase/ABC-type transport system involved in cytochrome c biogenesis ATPase subunit